MLTALLLAALAHASPLDAWGAATTTGAVAVNPNLDLSLSGWGGVLYVAYGPTRHSDVFAGYGSDGVELLPRWFPREWVGFAVHAFVDPRSGQVAVGPEIHGNWRRGRVDLFADVGWNPVLAPTLAGALAFGNAAAEWRPTDVVGLFLETRLDVPLAEAPVSWILTPGVAVDLREDESQELVAGLRLPLLGAPVDSAVLGVWWTGEFQVRAP